MYRPKRHWEEFKKLWARRHEETNSHPIYSGKTYAERSKQHLWYLPGPLAVLINVISGSLSLSKIDLDLSKPEVVNFVSLSGKMLWWVYENKGLTNTDKWLDYWWYLPVSGDSGVKSDAMDSLNLTRTPFTDLTKRLFVDGYIGPVACDTLLKEAEQLDKDYNHGRLDFEGTSISRIPPNLWSKMRNDSLRVLFKAKCRLGQDWEPV